MRVYAAHDESGRIIARAEIVDDEERFSVRIEPDGEQKVVELEIPEGFEERPFSELAEQYRVESGPGGPRLASR